MATYQHPRTAASRLKTSKPQVSRRPATITANLLQKDPLALAPHEALQLQQTVGNRATTQHLTGHTTVPSVQRVIKAKSGEEYTRAADLPMRPRLNATIAGWANAAEKTLVQSPADLDKRAQGQAAPVLTPHRHLIGEDHSASRFEEAVTAWVWPGGAARMEEAFNRSQTVKEPFTEQATNPGLLESKMFKGVIPLEDMHARTLADLADYRLFAQLMELRADQLRGEVAASNIQNKDRYERNRTSIEQKRQELMMRLEGYEAACTAILRQPALADTVAQAALRVMANAMNGQWEALKTRMKLVSSSPWNLVMADAGDQEVVAKLVARRDAAHTLIANMDTLAGYCTSILQAETDVPTGTLAGQSWATATGPAGDVLRDISPIREAMMARNINAVAKPLVVRIGSAHVTNLNGQITDGKYHDDFTDFAADVQGP